MPQSPSPTLCALTAADLDAAQALVVESGWNQVRADWELFLELGSVFKVAAPHGGVAATAATLPFAAGFGWISMVLVGKAHRRQGIATALLEHSIARLRGQGLVPVLDATPAGRSVYRPLGFHDGWAIARWRRGQPSPELRNTSVAAAPTVRPLRESDWPQLSALDARAFGADRTSLLRRLQTRASGFACVTERAGRVTGYLLGRNGRQATQVGPIVAREADQGQALLAHALDRIDGPVLIDALERHAGLAAQLTATGFSVERGYTRMTWGSELAIGDAGQMIAIAGPELG